MPRRVRLRKVVAPPVFAGYKPYGVKGRRDEKVELLYEEYEALKLADYDMLNHLEASEIMGVSRATFARIYESARRKIARSLVEGREIKAVYGNALLDHNWYKCHRCHARFTIPQNINNKTCPVCSSNETGSLQSQNNHL